MKEEATILALLQQRNRSLAAACSVTRSYESLLELYTQLGQQCTRQQHRADLLSKESHDMAADLELLRANEANAGVSKAHIELLQEQLTRATSEAEQSAKVANAATAREAETSVMAQQMADKLAESQSRVAELTHDLQKLTTSEEGLRGESPADGEPLFQTRYPNEPHPAPSHLCPIILPAPSLTPIPSTSPAENERMLQRLMDQLQRQAIAMDSEVRSRIPSHRGSHLIADPISSPCCCCPSPSVLAPVRSILSPLRLPLFPPLLPAKGATA